MRRVKKFERKMLKRIKIKKRNLNFKKELKKRKERKKDINKNVENS